MENRQGDRPRFDERSALEKLERFREDIERYRAKREAASQEREAFVRSFKTTQPIQAVGPIHDEVRQPVIEAIPASASAPAARVPDTPLPPTDGAAVVLPSAFAPPARRRKHSRTPALLGGALMLVAAGVWVTWMVRTPATKPAAVAPPPDTPPASPRTDQGATVLAAPAAPSPSFRTELTTNRPVWVRVVADGQRVVERELPANARVPLTAERTIVIRAGNAGAVRLVLAGQDQGVLGPEGAVVTRTFAIPRRAPR